MSGTRVDVAVIGGGLGGVAAALAVAEAGLTAVLTEETAWIGGQLTSQAVPPDEHPWIEQFGCTQRYRRLRDGIRDYYRRAYPLSARARGERWLNPGAGRVSGLCHEPRVALAVLEGMLAPHRSSGRAVVLTRHVPVGAEVDGDRVRTVTVRGPDGSAVEIAAEYFLDATETGELLPLTATEHVTGAEARAETGEPHAPETAQPDNVQATSVCFAMEHRAGEDHTVPRPEAYERWRAATLPGWTGPLLSWTAPHPHTLEPMTRTFTPNPGADHPLETGDDPGPAGQELWVFRRIAARRTFVDGHLSSDVTLVNWPMIDYVGGPLYGDDPSVVAARLAEAKDLSLSMLHWMQTEAPRPDGGTGYPGLRLRGDLLGTTDGLAMAPYHRESRRIRALSTVVEQDVSQQVRGEHGAVSHPDSVGIGSYRIDLHPSTGGDSYIDVASSPFEIPLRALVPQRVVNLLPAAKDIGTTHITNGCYRLHPVEWNVGEAAGELAAFCIQRRRTPHAVAEDANAFSDFERQLHRVGVETRWPRIEGY